MRRVNGVLGPVCGQVLIIVWASSTTRTRSNAARSDGLAKPFDALPLEALARSQLEVTSSHRRDQKFFLVMAASMRADTHRLVLCLTRRREEVAESPHAHSPAGSMSAKCPIQRVSASN